MKSWIIRCIRLTSFLEILAAVEYYNVNDKINVYRGQKHFRSVCSTDLFHTGESFSSSCEFVTTVYLYDY